MEHDASKKPQKLPHECVFCEVIQGNSNELVVIPELSRDIFVVTYDKFPTTPGHVLIMPKRHVQFMGDLRSSESKELIETVTETKEYLQNADLREVYQHMTPSARVAKSEAYIRRSRDMIERFNRPPDSFNDGVNDGPAAGQTISHFHWHVMPRWYGDVKDPRGGVRGMFTGLGNYHKGILAGSVRA